MTPTARVRVDWAEALARVLSGHGVRSVFQPIIDLRRGAVVGYEALTRFEHEHVTGVGPDTWFAAAREVGMGAELEAVVLRKIFTHRHSVPGNSFLTVNLDPNHLVEPLVRDVLREQGGLGGVVIEFTEHRDWDWERLAPSVNMLRRSGALVAIDDAGSGYSGLRQILELRPSILKLDRSLIEGVDVDEAKVALIEMIGGFANRIDAWILAEGVETMPEVRRLHALGVPLAQGYVFGRPEAPWSSIDPEVGVRIGEFADEPDTGLHELVQTSEPLRAGTQHDSAWGDSIESWRVVVDAQDRPVGIVDAESAFSGELVETVVVNVHTTPVDAARRLTTASAEPGAPLLVTDDTGRYLGLVTLRRLLEHLAT